MKKLLTLASVSVLTLALAVPGLARPDKTPPDQEPPEGLTCSEWEFDDPALWTVGSHADDFSVELTADKPAACFDVLSGAGSWAIDIAVVDAAGLQVQIKDSVPGDLCFREGYGGKRSPIPESIDVLVPAAGPDACTPGDVGLAADQDPALVFMVSFAPDRRASAPSATINVTLP